MNRFFSILAGICSFNALASPSVLTTTTTLASIVREIAGDRVRVESILKGPQDPHYVEAKPSYIASARKADALVSVGLGLESAWLDAVISGSRNPAIRAGGSGSLALGSLIRPIEVPQGTIDRSMGDVHAEGNPHFYLDPNRVIEVLPAIVEKLSALDPSGAPGYRARSEAFAKTLRSRTTAWGGRIRASGVTAVITYHKTLGYFLAAFGLRAEGAVEAKPGVPPTAKHLLDLSRSIREKGVRCMLVESFFDPAPARKVAQDNAMIVASVATEVGALAGVTDYGSLIEHLVAAVEACK